MPGARPAPMPPPPARLLDLTRTISRVGRMPTGVDRVERAYLDALLSRPEPLFALVRTTLGHVLLDPEGVAGIAARLSGARPWGPADALARVFARGKPEAVRQAESDLRRLARARCRPRGLGRMLARHLPAGTAYLNVGHAHLTAALFRALRRVPGARAAVMIHDVIPLELPECQRPGMAERFRAMLARVARHADLVIYNSADTRARAEAAMAALAPGARVPHGLTAHLGVPVPVPGTPPPGLGPDRLRRPYFICVGTIEPRKGHALLLDLWQMLGDGPEVPGLLICGARGWAGPELLARLDALPPDGPVRELPGLDDGQIAALMAGSRGLLLPSRAEGFGLPPAEAAALGVPVLCSDLPALREVLGKSAVYLDHRDVYQWKQWVQTLAGEQAEKGAARARSGFTPPRWEDHFNTVLSFT